MKNTNENQKNQKNPNLRKDGGGVHKSDILCVLFRVFGLKSDISSPNCALSTFSGCVSGFVDILECLWPSRPSLSISWGGFLVFFGAPPLPKNVSKNIA